MFFSDHLFRLEGQALIRLEKSKTAQSLLKLIENFHFHSFFIIRILPNSGFKRNHIKKRISKYHYIEEPGG